jgi:hypothetical protein
VDLQVEIEDRRDRFSGGSAAVGGTSRLLDRLERWVGTAAFESATRRAIVRWACESLISAARLLAVANGV